MNEQWLPLVAIAIATAITPGRYIAMILLFHTEMALRTSLSFVAGMASNMAIEGLIFALLFRFTGAFSDPSDPSAPPILYTVYIVMGALMLVGGLKLMLASKDDDDAPPAWLAQIDSFTPGKAYKLGLTWLFISPKQWVFVLSAVAVIFSAYLAPAASLFSYALYVLLALSVFLLLAALYGLFPDRSASAMEGLNIWLRSHAETIAIVVFFLFGISFLVSGISGLRAL